MNSSNLNPVVLQRDASERTSVTWHTHTLLSGACAQGCERASVGGIEQVCVQIRSPYLLLDKRQLTGPANRRYSRESRRRHRFPRCGALRAAWNSTSVPALKVQRADGVGPFVARCPQPLQRVILSPCSSFAFDPCSTRANAARSSRSSRMVDAQSANCVRAVAVRIGIWLPLLRARAQTARTRRLCATEE
jgi:hypothetical protein